MFIWRISNYVDLTGRGGLVASGRWHTKGHPIVCASDHPASALTEMLVHVDRRDLPDSFQLLKIEVPDDLPFRVAQIRDPRWRARPKRTQAVGDKWLAAKRSAILRVPSALMPHAFNFLINPMHKDAKRLRIVDAARVPLDDRLI